MDVSVALYSATTVLSLLLILFMFLLLTLNCVHRLRRYRFTWKSSISSSKLVSRSWNMAFDGNIEQVDVDRIVTRRQERIAESVERTMNMHGNQTQPLEHIDNDTAAVLAVDQLLDTSFLISDEELACYAPTVDMKIVGVHRDLV